MVLRVLVDANGLPLQVRMVRSSGQDYLDHIALETVRHWRLVPGRRKGQPESMWLTPAAER